MAATIPTSEPTTLTAGDSWQWNRTYGDYPASDGWALSYALTGAHESVITISATDASGVWQVRVAASDTKDYSPGPYRLVGYVSDGTDRHIVYSAPLTVLPDPATAVPDEGHNERMLRAIRCVLEGRIPADAEAYQIAGRSINRIPVKELVQLEAVYAERVRRERGGSFLQPVKVRFGPAA
ncbi:MAG TPA: hypothetical protein VF167_02905 [Longimicrobiaceae bacterium]